jgi:hypothetical protein
LKQSHVKYEETVSDRDKRVTELTTAVTQKDILTKQLEDSLQKEQGNALPSNKADCVEAFKEFVAAEQVKYEEHERNFQEKLNVLEKERDAKYHEYENILSSLRTDLKSLEEQIQLKVTHYQ